MSRKIGLTFLYLVLSYIVYQQKETIFYWIEHAPIEWVPIILCIATLLALFPIIPFPLVGAVVGATYDIALGSLITWLASTLASLLMFLFVRYGFHDWGAKVLERYHVIRKITHLFEQNAFVTILFARLIPLIPSIAINSYAALSRVSLSTFLSASALGKVPAMLLFAFLGAQWMDNPSHLTLIVILYVLFLGLIYIAYMSWKKKKP